MARTGSLLLTAAVLASAGCNQYELFRVAGYAQESFSNDADILFVVDNSSSMQDEAEALALNFDTFVRKLTDPREGAIETDGLPDAVDNYITYVQNRGRIVDYQLGITTTDVELSYGGLYGDLPLLDNEEPSIVPSAFNSNLLCDATCFLDASTLPDDAGYVCEETPAAPEQMSKQYLDCLCGAGQWEDQCGSGQEEHLEAVFMAMCRSVAEPPSECFESNQFTEADILSNEGLLRENSTLIPIIVTDEGDTSRRMSQGDPEPDEYADLFAKFNQRMAWAVIGPRTDDCNSGGATTWGVDRLQYFVDESRGRFFPISERDANGDCVVTDFESAMEELGDLLNSLLDAFPLQSIPDVATIVVFVEGEEVPRAAEITDETTGSVSYTDGWSYLAAENAVEFHGATVPDYNEEVRIYYKPLDGMPRELPF